jgi:hypothetical protein
MIAATQAFSSNLDSEASSSRQQLNWMLILAALLVLLIALFG